MFIGGVVGVGVLIGKLIDDVISQSGNVFESKSGEERVGPLCLKTDVSHNKLRILLIFRR